jgi:metal-responsive CopG/Arc/MetJ family transcriptional regulator
MNEKVESITVELPIELLQDLDKLSVEINKSRKVMVTEALNMYLAYQELSLQQKPIEDENNKPLTADEFFDDLDI